MSNVLHHGTDLETIGGRTLNEHGWVAALKWIATAPARDVDHIARLAHSITNKNQITKAHGAALIGITLRMPASHVQIAELNRRGHVLRALEKRRVLTPDTSYTVKCEAVRSDT